MRQKSVLEHCTVFLGLITLGGALAAGCNGDSESPAAPPPASQSAAKLRASFPEQAEHVLAAPGELASTAGGFVSAVSSAHPVAADLPKSGEDAVRLHLDDGWEIKVREHGLTGEGAMTDRAVSYKRAGGTSYWTAVPGGMEEWLHLEAGTVSRGGVAASWDVEGARLEQRGPAVALFDENGRARLWVTAPAAYKAGGEPLGVRLSVRGSTIEVSVDATPGEVLIDPGWVTAAPTNTARSEHAAVLLNNGKVLLMGGGSASITHASAETYDYTTNTWANVASMTTARRSHTATLLSDGRVLVVGGTIYNWGSTIASAEIYDPSTNTWSAAASLSAGRFAHQAVRLNDGRVLVMGGQTNTPTYLASAEIYDPSTNTWSSAASMADPRAGFASTQLADGRPIVMGGDSDWNNTTAGKGVEIYDPSTNTWSSAASMARVRLDFTAERLASGKILAASGDLYDSPGKSEVYDPSTNTWTLTGNQAGGFAGPRTQNATAKLNDGRVLLVGNGSGNYRSELYDPTTNSWSFDMINTARHWSTMTLLPNGQVIVAGGSFDETTQLYTAAAANGTSCTSNSQCSTGLCVDGVCCGGCGAAPWYSCMMCTVANGAPVDGQCTYVPAGTGTCIFANGVDCNADSQCASGYCVDGRCCNSACGGNNLNDCLACSTFRGASANGVCTTITTGSTCGSPNGTACVSNPYCQSGNCVDGVCCNTSCGFGSTTDCQACSVAAGASADGVCTTLTTGSCGSANGASCSSGSTCTSGFCVDGVCCNSACGGGSTSDCQACSTAAGASANGTCTTLTTGPTCGSANGATCSSGTTCQSGYCVDGRCCDSACGGNNSSDCQACSTAAGASANGTCTTLTTGPTCGSANGASCSSGSSCQSGHCVDGVCCNSACGGNSTTDCQACSTAAGASANGTCTTLTTGSCGSTPTCITIQRGTYGTVNEAHVNSSGASTNYGANATMSVGSSGSGNTRYGLLRFDLSAIPSTATITTATLTLSVFSGGSVDVRAHRITSSWSESTVTWNSFASAFNSTVELTMNGSTSYTGSLASLVQAWVNGTYSNYGIALERDLTANTIFHASEWTTTANRPQLYVCYQ